MFSTVFLVGQTVGSFAFGYITHAIGYAFMWMHAGVVHAARLDAQHGPDRPSRRLTGGAILAPPFRWTGASMKTRVRISVIVPADPCSARMPHRDDDWLRIVRRWHRRSRSARRRSRWSRSSSIRATQQPTVLLQGKRDKPLGRARHRAGGGDRDRRSAPGRDAAAAAHPRSLPDALRPAQGDAHPRGHHRPARRYLLRDRLSERRRPGVPARRAPVGRDRARDPRQGAGTGRGARLRQGRRAAAPPRRPSI